MTKPSWIRAEDGDWYRATEVVAVKTLPHAQGGFTVTVETHRHDNVDITGALEDAEVAYAGRDALVRILAEAPEGNVVVFGDGRFSTEAVG